MTNLLFTLYLTFVRIGLFTIGGGYAMIPLMEEEIISSRGWLTTTEFLDIIAVAEMTPGAVSINAATFIGYRLAGLPGSLVTSLGIITPSLVLLLTLSKILFNLIQNPGATSFLNGLRSALIALILLASYTLGLSAVIDVTTALIFGAVLAGNLIRPMSPFLIIGLGALLGLLFFPY